MQTLEVALGERSYPIYIGQDLLADTELYRRHIHSTKVVVVTDPEVAAHYLPLVKAGLGDWQVREYLLPCGEDHKTLQSVSQLFDFLLASGADRQTTLLALGGGIVGDMTGFAAACYQRGVPFVQLPTTLLAQVDSSVGGKTGVNHPLGKNMIGAFYQPVAVIADTRALGTLPDRQVIAGLAEVVKYGLIWDARFLTWLMDHAQPLLARERDHLTHAIHRSCQIKAEVVGRDEHEQNLRAILNLGHTFGHAVETATGYGRWLHGEAVGLGMRLAARLSARLNLLSVQDLAWIERTLTAFELPDKLPEGLTSEALWRIMQSDKKASAGKTRLVLLNGIGTATLRDDVPVSMIHEILTDAGARSTP